MLGTISMAIFLSLAIFTDGDVAATRPPFVVLPIPMRWWISSLRVGPTIVRLSDDNVVGDMTQRNLRISGGAGERSDVATCPMTISVHVQRHVRFIRGYFYSHYSTYDGRGARGSLSGLRSL